MKRSEFLEQVAAKRDGFTRSSVAAAAAVAEIAGVKWDPEEPDPPKRIGILWTIGDPAGPMRPVLTTIDGGRNRDLSTHECQTVIDAYNRLQAGELVGQEKFLEVVSERGAAWYETHETVRLLHHIASSLGMTQRITASLADSQNLAHDIQETIAGLGYHSKPADVISKTRRGRTVHYAIGPTRETREEAERDLREWFDKEES